MDLYRFLIRKNSIGGVTQPVIDTIEQWGIVCREVSFIPYPSPKNLPARDWPDEDGVDEYVPSQLKLSAAEIKVDFGVTGDVGVANTAIKGFVDYLTGRDGNGCLFSIYDEYTRIGKQNVRYLSIEDDATLERNSAQDLVLLFSMTFKCNDPYTDITLQRPVHNV